MNRLSSFTKNLKNKPVNLLWLIIILGLVLRTLYPLDRFFSFDQEQIANAAKQILQKDFTLIGPRTGPVAFHTGPFIYYLGALIYGLTRLHPIANTFIALAIYLLTAVFILKITKKKFSNSFRLVFLTLYSLSPYLISLDRITWNPNLSFLSASLIFFGLLNSNLLFVFTGMFFGYQAHFSAFIVFAISLLIIIFLKKSFKLAISLIVGLFTSLIPLIIFDLRHNWLNLKGLLSLLNNTEQIGLVDYLGRLFKNFLITFENGGKIVLYNLPFISLILFGLLIFIAWFRTSQIKTSFKVIVLAWLFSFPILISLYRESTPEYYFLMQLPVWIFIFTDVIHRFFKSRGAILFLIALMTFLSIGIVISHTDKEGLSLKDKLLALTEIKKQVNNHQVNLVYDMDLAQQHGWQYLLDYLNLQHNPNLPVKTHLIYPLASKSLRSTFFGSLGIWVDKRDLYEEASYLNKDSAILFYFPKDWLVQAYLEKDYYPGKSDIKIMKFGSTNLITDKTNSIYYLYFPKNANQEYLRLDKIKKTDNDKKWNLTSLNHENLEQPNTYYHSDRSMTHVFIFPQSYSSEDIFNFFNKTETL